MENRFNIDFIEFSILVEACITPAPIACGMFFQNVSDIYYNVLTENERNRLFEWVLRSSRFNIKDDDCNLFYHRYNPENQYLATTNYKNKIEKHQCFKYNNKYHTTKSTWIEEKYIKKITLIQNTNDSKTNT